MPGFEDEVFAEVVKEGARDGLSAQEIARLALRSRRAARGAAPSPEVSGPVWLPPQGSLLRANGKFPKRKYVPGECDYATMMFKTGATLEEVAAKLQRSTMSVRHAIDLGLITGWRPSQAAHERATKAAATRQRNKDILAARQQQTLV